MDTLSGLEFEPLIAVRKCRHLCPRSPTRTLRCRMVHLARGFVTSEIGEDRDGLAAAETPRRPHGLRRVSWTGCGVSTGTLEPWPEVGVTAVLRTCVCEISVTSTHRYRNTVSVETTQPVHDTLRRPRGRRVVSAAAMPARSSPTLDVANPDEMCGRS